MLDEGRNCEDVVIPLAAASKALDRAGLGLDAGGLRECLNMGDDAHIDTAKLERLFVARLILSPDPVASGTFIQWKSRDYQRARGGRVHRVVASLGRRGCWPRCCVGGAPRSSRTGTFSWEPDPTQSLCAPTALAGRLLRTRWVVRGPLWLYRMRLGFRLGNRMLMLEHRGRSSGLRRYAVLEVVDRPPPTSTSTCPDSDSVKHPSGIGTCSPIRTCGSAWDGAATLTPSRSCWPFRSGSAGSAPYGPSPGSSRTTA